MRGHRGEYEITAEVDGKKAATTLRVSDKGENTVRATVGENSISLSPSEPVNKKPYKQHYRVEEVYEEDINSGRYKKLYENKIDAVTGPAGQELEFLIASDPFDVEDESIAEKGAQYILENGRSITAQMEAPLKEGVVRVTMPQSGETPCMCRIEGRLGSGDWFFIGNSDSLDTAYLSFERELDQVRVSGIGTVAIKGIHVSKKEWVR